MKKYLLLILCVALSCVSCQDKNNEDIPEISETDEVQGDVSRNSFREYTDRDFKDINVIVSRSQAQLPVNTYEKSISLNLGKRVSPCKAEDLYEKFIPYYYINPDYPSDEEYIKDMLSAPSAGRAEWWCIDGNMMYFIVSHDDFCYYFSHDISIYSYNFDTEITEELYNYSGTDYGLSINRLYYNNGLFFITEKAYTDDMTLTSHGWDYGESGEKRETTLCRLDEKNQKIITVSKDPYTDYYFSESENGFIIKNAEFSGTNNQSPSYILSEYDISSNKMNTVFSGAVNEIPVPCADGFVTYIKNDNKNITVNAENYTLSTELQGDVSCVTKNRLIISHSDNYRTYSKDKIYVYDFNSMERYILDLSDYGNRVMPYGENLIIYSEFAKYYLVPELGTAFYLGMTEASPEKDNQSGRIYFTNIVSDDAYISYMDDDGNLKLEETKGGTEGNILFVE
ncbi:MAG: hypothetical protein IJ666_07270 [Ruminococcus sp.]|nr:hypothetical protein [Ruminococcus sp.]